MPKAPNYGVDNTLKLKKLNQIIIFSTLYFQKFFLKSSFSINKSILKKNDYDFSIQDFV